MAHHDHNQSDVRSVRVGVVTISDTRTEADDTSGRNIQNAVTEAGHDVAFYRVVKDEPHEIAALVRSPPEAVDVVITSGGTGLAPRDTTFEAVSQLIEREIPGFGELFRMLSYDEIGAAAMLSRAVAGTVGDRVVFCLPGSSKAVDLAMAKLIIPQVRHLVGLMTAR